MHPQGKENKGKSKPARVRANNSKGLSEEGGREKRGKEEEEEEGKGGEEEKKRGNGEEEEVVVEGEENYKVQLLLRVHVSNLPIYSTVRISFVYPFISILLCAR